MTQTEIISKLKLNKNTFVGLLAGVDEEEFLFRPFPEHWCLLEIVCHLYDEECEDFRKRIETTLQSPGKLPPSIDPQGWVISRKYIEEDYPEKLSDFINERKKSIEWLSNLENPIWTNSYVHPEFGAVSADFFLKNWLAHDLLHIRQIARVKYQYLKSTDGQPIDYAGNW